LELSCVILPLWLAFEGQCVVHGWVRTVVRWSHGWVRTVVRWSPCLLYRAQIESVLF